MVRSRQLLEFKRNSNVIELRELMMHFNELMLKIKAYHASLEALSNSDQLTGIPNRRAYEHFVYRAWNRMQRRKAPLRLILCDIDFSSGITTQQGMQTAIRSLGRLPSHSS